MGPPTEPLVLGVDLDGVCVDFIGRMREIVADWLECPLESLASEVTYGLKEWGITTPKQYESLHRYAVTQRDIFRSAPMIPGARKYLRMLSDEGVRIRIVTNRLYISYFHVLAVQQTIEWLDRMGLPYSDLCFLGAKDQVGADIYIEDMPENIARLRAAGLYTICFSNSVNREVPEPRADSWETVYAMVKARIRTGADHQAKGTSAPPHTPRKRRTCE